MEKATSENGRTADGRGGTPPVTTRRREGPSIGMCLAGRRQRARAKLKAAMEAAKNIDRVKVKKYTVGKWMDE